MIADQTSGAAELGLSLIQELRIRAAGRSLV